MTPEVTIVVPVLNEEENVEPLHRELAAVMRELGRSHEMLFIDDGSTDRTCERLRGICSRDPHVSTIRLRRTYGQTAALQAGFDLAHGRVVVTLDGDLQNDPRDIGRLLEQVEEGFDVVCGWRRQRRDRFVSRRLPSLAANWLIGRITGFRIHDSGCTLKAYRAEVVKRVSLYSEMHRFLVPLLGLSGSRYTEIVVNHRERRFGRSKYGLSRIWKVFFDLFTVKMIVRFVSHPAVWFSLLGAPFAVACALSALLSVVAYATVPTEEFAIVMPSITILFFFASVQLFLLGMFAELVTGVGDFREAEVIVPHREEAS